ncbi:hypothetical protein PoB_001238300 [Plakobranchus ocellatus]|uniref:Uncharacterized protein n=1 Tax=Plakobranchus ocellatus TaxID=259542 RepID=A0AAV3YTL4_9GAST|nr:hypothetical protein PoB_001238300 [Plakobranchus ocellatus]
MCGRITSSDPLSQHCLLACCQLRGGQPSEKTTQLSRSSKDIEFGHRPFNFSMYSVGQGRELTKVNSYGELTNLRGVGLRLARGRTRKIDSYGEQRYVVKQNSLATQFIAI